MWRKKRTDGGGSISKYGRWGLPISIASRPTHHKIPLLSVFILLVLLRESAKLRKPYTDIFLACSPTLHFKVKRRAFKRCLTNLVNNACNHAEEVRIIVKMEDESMNIIISDNGPGIPEESMNQVFRPFFRLDQARNAETGGTGLGLSVARDVARGHGGDIYLSKGTQGGLEATVSVPA